MEYPVVGHYASHGSCSNCGKQNTDNSQWAFYCVSCIESVYDPPKTAIAAGSNSSELICANCIRLFAEKTALQHDIARHVAICADQATEIECEEKRVADLMDQVAGMAMKIERLRERTEKLEGRLLHHYDALSDWPLTEGHAKEMCRRVETLFPDLFGTAATKEE